MSDWNSISALLAGVPDLPDARCKGNSRLFASTVAEGRFVGQRAKDERDAARAAALALCAACGSLPACRAYCDGLKPSQRPPGVFAGQVITTTGQPSKTWTTSTRTTTSTAPATEDTTDE